MRSQKALVALLRDLVQLLADESERNPAFAERLDNLLSSLPESRRPTAAKRAARDAHTTLLDVHAEWTARGETDFRLWLRDHLALYGVKSANIALGYQPTALAGDADG